MGTYLISQNETTLQLIYTEIKINNLPLIKYNYLSDPVALNNNYFMFTVTNTVNNKDNVNAYIIDKSGKNLNFEGPYYNYGIITD